MITRPDTPTAYCYNSPLRLSEVQIKDQDSCAFLCASQDSRRALVQFMVLGLPGLPGLPKPSPRGYWEPWEPREPQEPWEPREPREPQEPREPHLLHDLWADVDRSQVKEQLNKFGKVIFTNNILLLINFQLSLSLIKSCLNLFQLLSQHSCWCWLWNDCHWELP